ncbi:thioredoxin-dependent thiol peroxidase [Paramagnetospirillum kuznetsovii]|uniref:thioredoxin-dependent peroxiredoxin n=1 Tax=Paramagnetospirillum kuznetsovii TaxID=2053833 RepID=A0A364NZ54_9PROT|nr:thioredoxin-dependent thiol peroxidase [Paramagnetospirillum kuznetsovii]RAU22323.1 thioredoxin-dependent thiol peroxidase [Paramagnetospirillum kuznetsovii]
MTTKPAPDFSMDCDDGKTCLADYQGKLLVLYFYPKDDTSGCTSQAKAFRDSMAEYKAAGVEILGVSKDSVASHAKFRAKHELPFRLGSDPDGAVCEAYGVWKKKSMYGREYMGIERSTFLIDKSGAIAREWRKVKVTGHAAEVLAAAKAL